MAQIQEPFADQAPIYEQRARVDQAGLAHMLEVWENSQRYAISKFVLVSYCRIYALDFQTYLAVVTSLETL